MEVIFLINQGCMEHRDCLLLGTLLQLTMKHVSGQTFRGIFGFLVVSLEEACIVIYGNLSQV
jgi:hypothetical protein